MWQYPQHNEREGVWKEVTGQTREPGGARHEKGSPGEPSEAATAPWHAMNKESPS